MQQKVFRIEQMFAHGGARPRPLAAAPAHDDGSVHALIADYKRDLAALMHDGEQRRMTLAASELGAAIEAMEQATQGILKSAEHADGSVQALSAALAREEERALAENVRTQLARIFEACNFQDIAGQRIGKVIETLCTIEAHLAAILANGPGDGPRPEIKPDKALINGPRLDGASGHVSQQDIDRLFG
jgi:chemotaxis protein CheZ